MNKFIKSIVLIFCCMVILIIIKLGQNAIVSRSNIFSYKNIIGSLETFIICIPIAYILYKYFDKDK